MRVVIDTNILVSALIAPAGKPAAIIDAWLDGKFTLLTCATPVGELRSTLHKPRVAELIKPYKAGRLVNQIKKLAEDVDPLPPRGALLRSHGRFSACHVRRRPGRLSGDGRQERSPGPRQSQSHADRFREGICRAICMSSPPRRLSDNCNYPYGGARLNWG